MFYPLSELDVVVDNLKMNLSGLQLQILGLYFIWEGALHVILRRNSATFSKHKVVVFAFQIEGVFLMLY